jgi:hypothetical protein
METIIHLVLCANMIHTAVLTPDVIRKHHQLTGLKGPPQQADEHLHLFPDYKKQAATV